VGDSPHNGVPVVEFLKLFVEGELLVVSELNHKYLSEIKVNDGY